MFLRFLSKTEEAIISLLLVAMTLLVFWDVILRFFFNTGVTWSQEATLLICAWFVLFGASYGLKVGAHIGVDAFVRLFPPLGQRLLTILAILLSFAYCGLFMYGAWIYLSKMHRIGIELEDLPIPTWLADSVLLIGFALFFIRLMQLLWTVIFHGVTGFQQTDEAKESMHLAEELREEQERSAS